MVNEWSLGQPVESQTVFEWVLGQPFVWVDNTAVGEQTASFTPLLVSLTIPAITATRVAEYTSAFTALSVVLTIPSMTASSGNEFTASFTALPVSLTIPSMTATGVAEYTVSFTALSVLLTIPAFTPSHVLEKTSSFTALSVVLTIPAMTAVFSTAGGNVFKVWSGTSWEIIGGKIVTTTRTTSNITLDATHHNVFGNTDSAGLTITLPAGIEGTYYRIINSSSSGNIITITPNGSEHLIGDNSNFTLSDGETLIIVYNATDGWY